jgi:hypothetical protein
MDQIFPDQGYQTKGYSKQWYRRALQDGPYHYLPVRDDSTKAKEPTMF